jgi:hypothetical protein
LSVDVVTPLQKLDNAIEEFFRETEQLGDGGFITGWALGVSKAKIQAAYEDRLPLVSGLTYAFGPQTNVDQLAGLAKYLDTVAEKAMWASLDDDEDDD